MAPRKVNAWLQLAEQFFNAIILASLAALPLVLYDISWRVMVVTWGMTFLGKLALYRGLRDR